MYLLNATVMIRLAVLLAAIIALYGTSFVPAEFRQLSTRRRRAVRFALATFRKVRDTEPSRFGTRIYKTEGDRTIVMVPHMMSLQPVIRSFFAVPHAGEDVVHLGTGQVSWGIRPEDLWREEPPV